MNILIVGVIIFIFSLMVLELSFYAYRNIKYPDRATVRRRLNQSIGDENQNTEKSIIKNIRLSDVPFIHRFLTHIPGIHRMQSMIDQANVNNTLGFFILLSITLGLTSYLLGSLLLRDPLLSCLAAIFALCLPLVFVQFKKKKRMAKFEKQLPEALDLIARALKAGHAFSSGMKLSADEFPDPLGPYFEETLDEINFGVSVADALKNLTARVDCPDLRFFVVSVILQRETGGNLAEIIEGLAHLIRERFKFRGKVKTLSAEGRLSGKILVAVPLLLFLVLYMINPAYAGTLIVDSVGRMMTVIAFFMTIFAWLMIRRIVSIDV